MNTLCNDFRHLTYLAESLCNHFRISEVMGFIFRSRLYCLSQVRFAEIEIRPAEAESVNSWRRMYWYENFPFLDSYFMHLASESWIRKQEFALLEFPVFWQTFYRGFLNCRPKVYLFNTHWLWKYLQKLTKKLTKKLTSDPPKVKVSHQDIFSQEQNLVKFFCRQAWPMVSGN